MLSGSLMKKEKEAIERLQAFSAEEPYYLCYSGGKDSDTIRILAELANVNFEVHNNHTTVDAPETVYYIREVIKQYGDKGFIHYPEKTMWQLIVEKLFPPTRLARYCCAELKEKGGRGRRKVTGIRWAEYDNRKKKSRACDDYRKTSDGSEDSNVRRSKIQNDKKRRNYIKHR